jgi:hypothetical protein
MICGKAHSGGKTGQCQAKSQAKTAMRREMQNAECKMQNEKWIGKRGSHKKWLEQPGLREKLSTEKFA